MSGSAMSRRDLIKRAGTASLALPLGGGLLAACGGSSASGHTSLMARLKQTGVARVAIANEPPYTKVTPDGTTTGVEPDVAKAVLKRLGIPNIEGVIAPYESMIPGLYANRWDMITAGLFMKKSRCARIDYSSPVLVSTESFAVPKGNPKHITTVADVKKNPSLKVAAISGAFEYGILKGAGISGVVGVPDARSGIEGLSAGRYQAFMLPTLSLKALQSSSHPFDVTPPVPDAPKTGSGAGFRKSDASFVAKYNAVLDKFKTTPEYAQILDKWGFDPSVVKGVTTQELCKDPG